MSRKLIISTYKNKDNIYETTQEIKELCNINSAIKIEAGLAFYKDEYGNIEILKSRGYPLWGTVNSAVIGGLIGLIAGPFGISIGTSLGTTIAIFNDVFDINLDHENVYNIMSDIDMAPAIIIFDVFEDDNIYLDEIVIKNKGTIHRCYV